MMEKIRIAVVGRRKVTHGQDWYKRSEGETYFAVKGVEERAVLMPVGGQAFLTINQKYAIVKCLNEGKKDFKDTFDDRESWLESKKEYEDWQYEKEESQSLQQQLGDDFIVDFVPSSDMCPVKLNLSDVDLNESKDQVGIYKLLGGAMDKEEMTGTNTIIDYLHSYYRKLMYKLPFPLLNEKYEYAYYDTVGKYHRSLVDVISLKRRKLYPLDIALEQNDYQLVYDLFRSGARKSERKNFDRVLETLIEKLKSFSKEEGNTRFQELCKNLSIDNCCFREIETLYCIADRCDMNLYYDFVECIKKRN